jgi:parallel beta-helix repeat protein
LFGTAFDLFGSETKMEVIMKHYFTVPAFIILFITLSHSTVYQVPSPGCPTIQAGLDSCSANDTVMVSAGIYFENLLWPGTAGIDLISESDTDSTIIDGGGVGCVISILSGVGNTTVINGFTIQNGHAPFGAGIYCRSGSAPEIMNNTIRQNTAYDQGGGGIGCSHGSSPRIHHNYIIGNTASAGGGGGIEVVYSSNPTIENNTVTNNLAGLGGGGILIHNGCSAIITANEIAVNTALTGGGGLFLQGSASTVTDNTITGNNSGGGGGGIGLGQMDISTIDGNDISRNSAIKSGGGIRCKSGASPTIKNNVISYNWADSTGGGICCHHYSNPTITGNQISHNRAYRSGGGIRCAYNSSPIITHNIIKQDTAGYPGGGGIACSYDSSPTITENLITENVAINGGGAGIFCAFNSNPVIENDTLLQNRADLGGGGILVYEDCTPRIIDSEIKDNTAGSSGGGIAFYQSFASVKNNTITGNTAYRGGGLNFQEYDSSMVTNSFISLNTTVIGIGDGIRCDSYSSPTFDSCTVYANSNDSSYGIFCEGGAYPLFHFNDIFDSFCNADSLLDTINAEHNWWGDASGPFNSGSNPSGSGCVVSCGVDYQPWLIVPVVGIKRTPSESLPGKYVLFQNYPNPFNPSTTIEFALPTSSAVTLNVYNILGEEVTTLLSAFLPSGSHSVEWNASDLASGVYLYRLQAGEFIETKKMVLMR